MKTKLRKTKKIIIGQLKKKENQKLSMNVHIVKSNIRVKILQKIIEKFMRKLIKSNAGMNRVQNRLHRALAISIICARTTKKINFNVNSVRRDFSRSVIWKFIFEDSTLLINHLSANIVRKHSLRAPIGKYINVFILVKNLFSVIYAIKSLLRHRK